MKGFQPSRRQEAAGGRVLVYVQPPEVLGLPEVCVPLTTNQFIRYTRWLTGHIALIQDALPELSPTEREMLLSGLGDPKEQP